jgi:hypothetical protein
MLGIQLRGGAMQRGKLARRAGPELKLQQFGEQLVVAEPGPARIQRDHERAGLLQLLQDPFPACLPTQDVGQRAADLLKHRGPQQELPNLLRLPLQHLSQ